MLIFYLVADIGSLEVANEDGRRSYIRDIARVTMATEELRHKADIDDRACIAIKFFRPWITMNAIFRWTGCIR